MKGWSSDVARFDKTGLPDTAARRRQTALSADNYMGTIKGIRMREEEDNEWMTKLRNECVALSRRRSLVQVRRRVCPKFYDNSEDEEKWEHKREQAINRRSREKKEIMSVWQVRCLTATGKNVCWLDKYIRLLLYTEYSVQGTERNNSSVRRSFRRHRVWTGVGARFSAGDTSDGRLRVSSTCTEYGVRSTSSRLSVQSTP